MNAKLPSFVGLLSVFVSPIFAQALSPSTPTANYLSLGRHHCWFLYGHGFCRVRACASQGYRSGR